MSSKHASSFAVLVLLTAPFAAAAATPPPELKNSELGVLGRYIPGDVCVYMEARSTEDREFIAHHWEGVFNAFKTSGILSDFRNLLTAEMSPAEQADFEEFWSTATQLIDGVVWEDLVANNFAFAERLEGLFPDIYFLGMPKAETLDKNTEGLVRILEVIAEQSEDISVVKDEPVEGATRWNLIFNGAPFSVQLLRHNDLLALVLGRPGASDDVVELRSGTADFLPLIATERYKTALTKVPDPEYFVSFVDFKRLFSFIEAIPTRMFGEEAVSPDIATTKKCIHKVIQNINVFDYVVTVGVQDGLRETQHNYMCLREDAADRALYKVLNDREPVPVEEIAKYLPADATGFSATAPIDITPLYDAALDLVREDIPEGEQLLARWEAFQGEIGFNVKEDLLSWVTGQTISISMPATTQSPFGASGEGVMLLGVSDSEKAAAKLDSALKWLQNVLANAGQPLMISRSESLEGFHSINHPMMAMSGMQPCVGVWKNWLAFGTSAKALRKVMNASENSSGGFLAGKRFKKEGIELDGPVYSVHFTDLTQIGSELGMAFFSMGMMSAMIPDQPDTRVFKSIISAMGKLGPVVAQIDFLVSSSGKSDKADDGGWRTVKILNYRPYNPPASPSPSANGAHGSAE